MAWYVQTWQPEDERAKWRAIFRRLGVDTLLLADEQRTADLLCHGPAGLAVLDRQLLAAARDRLLAACEWWIDRGGGIALTGAATDLVLPARLQETMTDISGRDPILINALLQQHLPAYTRRQPRLETRLPGIYSLDGATHICEITSIGPGGAFLRTAMRLPVFGSVLRLIIPLLGLRREIEVEAEVVRQVTPSDLNNFQQGIGVAFRCEQALPFSLLAEYLQTILNSDSDLLESTTVDPRFSHQGPSPAGGGVALPTKSRDLSLTRNR